MKILHLEDNAQDAELVGALLRKNWPGCLIHVVPTREPFCAALRDGGHDIILSDFTLVSFTGLEALEIARREAPDTPFIFLSATIGEERAIEAVHSGAHDYVLKDNMARLVTAIRRALRDSEERQQHKLSAQALAQEQILVRALLESTPDHVYFKNLHSRFITISRSMAARHGLKPGDAVGKTDFDLFSTEHAQKALEDEQRIIRTGQPMVNVEEKETWPDGSITWVSTTKLPLQDAAGQAIGTIGISRDITAHKQTEAHIREQAELLNKTGDLIIVTDLNGCVTFWNDGAERLSGWRRTEVVGRRVDALLVPGEADRGDKIRQTVIETGAWQGEVRIQSKSGTSFDLDVRVTLLRDDAGRPTGRLNIATDITEKKKLQAQFLRVQRLESLGMLAAGIAHDLNNVLAPILMGAPLLRRNASDPGDLRLISTLEKAGERGAGLVRQILGFAHGIGGEPQFVQVQHLLRDITELVTETFPKSISLQMHIPSDLWPLMANPTQIHQVLLNLCVNARDAMPQGGTLGLSAENCVLDEAAAGGIEGARLGKWLVLQVEDTGTGIPPEVLARIWDPFFTTKTADKGTGLGLSTVRGIVEHHHGFVTLATAPDLGTTFRVYLPPAETAMSSDTSTIPPFANEGKGELILIADDEDSIRELAGVTLTHAGYRVMTAQDGTEAAVLFSAHAHEIALVITDLDMPNLDGVGLARAIRAHTPQMKILIMSGQDSISRTKDMPHEQFATAMLAKPFTIKTLRKAVHDLLHGKSAPS